MLLRDQNNKKNVSKKLNSKNINLNLFFGVFNLRLIIDTNEAMYLTKKN